MRSLAIEHTFNDFIYRKEYEAQYYFGPSILIAPITSMQKIAKVYLPEGQWYDFFNGDVFQGNNEIYLDTPLYKIPVFVKEGSVIPSQPVVQNTVANPGNDLILHIYKGETNSTFNYFEDDGSTYEYTNGNYYHRKLIFDWRVQKIILEKPEGSYKSKFRNIKAVLHGFSEVSEFTINGQSVQKEATLWRFIEPLQDFDPQGRVHSDNPEKVFSLHFGLENNIIEISWT